MEKVEIKANVFQFSKCPINAIFCWRKSGVSLQEGSRLFLTSSCFQPSSSWCHCQYPAKCRRQCQAGVINLSIYHKLIHNFYISGLQTGLDYKVFRNPLGSPLIVWKIGRSITPIISFHIFTTNKRTTLGSTVWSTTQITISG